MYDVHFKGFIRNISLGSLLILLKPLYSLGIGLKKYVVLLTIDMNFYITVDGYCQNFFYNEYQFPWVFWNTCTHSINA